MAWPPAAEEFYLSDHGPRPIFQGDIYEDVPFTKAGAGNNFDAPPNLTASKRRHVAVLLHPCYIVDNDNVTPIRAQPVAGVYEAGAAGLAISEDWGEGTPWSVCPLPDLVGDGKTWVVDFRAITVVDRSYLRPENRIACLSEMGWAVFRQRYLIAATRGSITIDDLKFVGKATWIESEMETLWRGAGRDPRAFHDWLDADDAVLGYQVRSRRDMVDSDPEVLWDWLRAELGLTDPGT